MKKDYEIEIDDSIYSLLDTIVKSNGDPLTLAALAEINPDDFRPFLKECGEDGSRDSIQLLRAAQTIKVSNTQPTISTPALNTKTAVSDHKQNLTFIILSKDPAESKEISRALSSNGGASLLLTSEDSEQVYTETLRLQPSAVIINLSGEGESELKLVQRIISQCSSTAVICAARTSSPDLILRSMRAGAHNFFQLPIIEQELISVIDHTAAFLEDHVADESRKRGRAIAVFSAKGGCGCSVIATNLALLQPNSTVLVDLDLHWGALDLLLGLQPKLSLAEVVENRERLDDALLSAHRTKHSNVSLLAAPLIAESAEKIEPRHIYEILESLRHQFESVIIDTPHTFDPVTLAALDHADEILVVLTIQELQAIRSTQRALKIFDRLGYPRKKIRLVVNRWSKDIHLEPKYIEEFLGERIIGFIPSDEVAVTNSIKDNQPAVISAPSSRFAKEMVRIVKQLSTRDDQKVENIKALADSQVPNPFKNSIFDDFPLKFRPKEST